METAPSSAALIEDRRRWWILDEAG